MAVATGQVSAGTAPAFFTVGAGVSSTVVTNGGTVTAYLSAGGTATTSNGVPVPSGGILPPIQGYNGAPGVTYSVVTGGGTATIGYLVSTAAGSTGI